MLSWLLAIPVFLLGARAFTKEGIPLSRTKNLTGTVGHVCGGFCVLFGVLLVLDGLFGIASLVRVMSQ